MIRLQIQALGKRQNTKFHCFLYSTCIPNKEIRSTNKEIIPFSHKTVIQWLWSTFPDFLLHSLSKLSPSILSLVSQYILYICK